MIDTKKLKEAADAVMADIASKKNGSIWPSGQIPILFIPGTPGMDYVVDLRPEVVDELLAQLEKAEIDPSNPDLMVKLMQRMSAHPQLKAVIGREALILRCVRDALKDQSC